MIRRVLDKLEREGFLLLMVWMIKYPFRYKRRSEYKKMLSKSSLKDRFGSIYDNRLWLSKESLSGEGSEVEYTKPLREWLGVNLPNLNIGVFVDAPCGDFNWMQLVLPDLELQYIGLDIVPSVIGRNNQLYATNNIKFQVSNICEDKLPSCDLIMVRDCLFHLSYFILIFGKGLCGDASWEGIPSPALRNHIVWFLVIL